jgi:hypothetical protein
VNVVTRDGSKTKRRESNTVSAYAHQFKNNGKETLCGIVFDNGDPGRNVADRPKCNACLRRLDSLLKSKTESK